jgi:hypothetical protein
VAAKTVKLDQAKKAVTVQGLRLEQRMVFEFFDKQPEAIRDQLAAKAMMIGVLALAEERLAAFLSRTPLQGLRDLVVSDAGSSGRIKISL